jgi:hypothetical protein
MTVLPSVNAARAERGTEIKLEIPSTNQTATAKEGKSHVDDARKNAPSMAVDEQDALLQKNINNLKPVTPPQATAKPAEELAKSPAPAATAAAPLAPTQELHPRSYRSQSALSESANPDLAHDGKFSGWEFAKNIGASFIAPFTSCFSSWSNFGKAVAVAAGMAAVATAAVVTFPVSAPLIIGGLSLSGAGMVSGALTGLAVTGVAMGGYQAYSAYKESARTGNWDTMEQQGAQGIGIGLFSALPFIGRAGAGAMRAIGFGTKAVEAATAESTVAAAPRGVVAQGFRDIGSKFYRDTGVVNKTVGKAVIAPVTGTIKGAKVANAAARGAYNGVKNMNAAAPVVEDVAAATAAADTAATAAGATADATAATASTASTTASAAGHMSPEEVIDLLDPNAY